MAMLYPPYIEGKIQAQWGDTLRIPFQLNRAIADSEIDQVVARLRTVSTNQQILSETELNCDLSDCIKDGDVYYTKINFDTSKLTIGQYYKIQLAFTKDLEVGYFSTVGVFKYTSKPNISIECSGLQYKGTFSTEDKTEKVMYYKFDVYYNNEIVETTDWQVHNESIDIFIPETQVYPYTIKYSVKTTGDLNLTTQAIGYAPLEFSPEYNFEGRYVVSNSEDGIIKVGFRPKEEVFIKGNFRVYRSHQENLWELMHTITFNQIFFPGRDYSLFEDFTVEQGKTYTYALQHFDNFQVTKKIIFGSTSVDFEDSFLYDGERQLKIKFNPKISSFKTVLLETKLDTIGGKYPFFFKNGLTEYKDFPISGLISLQMDDNQRFLKDKKEDLDRTETLSKDNIPIKPRLTDLVQQTVLDERYFKLEVLNWLNNGEPKLFRSPVEGNYLVRLMNISLAPEDRLGRMLHTFNANAYEIAECNFKELQNHNIIMANEKFTKTLNHTVVEFTSKAAIEINKAIKVRVLKAEPNSSFIFTTLDGTNTTVIIGRNGYYECYIDQSNPIVKIEGAKNSIVEYFYREEKTYPIDEDLVGVKEYFKIERWSSNDNDFNFQDKYKRIIYLRLEKKDLEYSSESPESTQTTIYLKSDAEALPGTGYSINGKEFRLDSGRIELTDKDIEITSLSFENGIYADVYYRSLEVNSDMEYEDESLVLPQGVEVKYNDSIMCLELSDIDAEYNSRIEQLIFY